VSGQSYADYLEEHLLNPLGMKNTGYECPLAVIDWQIAFNQATDGRVESLTLLQNGQEIVALKVNVSREGYQATV